MTKVECKNCGKTFGYEHTGNIYPGGKDREYIICPYCRETNGSIMISGFVYTYKLDENGNKIY